jgi:hypothetical protein
VSYSIDRRWQPFLQYEYIHFDAVSLAAGAENEVHVIRVGTSYFIYGESARFQFDLSYLPNGSPVNDDGAGILQDNGNNELVFPRAVSTPALTLLVFPREELHEALGGVPRYLVSTPPLCLPITSPLPTSAVVAATARNERERLIAPSPSWPKQNREDGNLGRENRNGDVDQERDWTPAGSLVR